MPTKYRIDPDALAYAARRAGIHPRLEDCPKAPRAGGGRTELDGDELPQGHGRQPFGEHRLAARRRPGLRTARFDDLGGENGRTD